MTTATSIFCDRGSSFARGTMPAIEETLSQRLSTEPHLLAKGDSLLNQLARDTTKSLYDKGVQEEKASLPYISALLDACVPRGQQSGKRKRANDGTISQHPLFPPTELNELVLEGMGNDQIWHQLELRSAKLARVLDHVISSGPEDADEEESEEENEKDADDLPDDDEAWDEEDDEEEESDEGFAGASDLSDVDPNEVYYEPLHTEEMQHMRKEEKERQEMMQMYGVSDPALYDALTSASSDDDEEEEEDKEKPRHPTLDDDFFSIDEFNRLTEAQERQEHSSRAHLSGEEEEEDMDGIDLFAPVDEDEGEDEMDVSEIRYADFFDPIKKKRPAKSMDASPPRAPQVRFHDQVRVRPIKKAKSQSLAGLLTDGDDEEDEDGEEEGEDDNDEEEEEEDDDDEDEEGEEEDDDEEDEEGEEEEDDDDEEEEEDEGEEDEEEEADEGMEGDAAEATAGRVAQDLFAEEEQEAPSSMSRYEQHQAELAEEIARYEDENVREKDWVLMGEASTRQRPVNSLLEEDLEFERTAKAAPVQTHEHGEGIEAMIKRRILDRHYDDVVRQRELEALPFAASSMLELSDTKSAKSLAELYEEEYQAARGEEAGDGAPRSEADVKLDNDHAALAADMDTLFSKLDALSNAHYTPKAPKAAIQTVSNTPSMAIESALPTTMSAGSMLAPEEVYERPTHSAALEGDKSEMSHAEKQRLHNKLRHEKRRRNDRIKRTEEAIQRQRGDGPRSKSETKADKDKALKSLVGHKGVTVVGKEKREKKKAPASWKL